MKCFFLQFNLIYLFIIHTPTLRWKLNFSPRLKMNFLGETFNETNNHHRVFCSSPVLPAINFHRDEDKFIRRSCPSWLKWND